ncbi:hypothetical protein PFISCL1PPCAC_5879, partial [Pristionchus fissidentatus]
RRLRPRERACFRATSKKDEGGTSSGSRLAVVEKRGDRPTKFLHSFSSTANSLGEGRSSRTVDYT